mmetsp:Transcript_146657/g.468464  ORF Transcript_146657/g.468464 Transcript_146657/m.468464 type:complete len:631 (+) Transcript_146657:61-1953(+)
MGACNGGLCPQSGPDDHGVWVEEVTGRRRALLVGINYRGSSSELNGCINDIENQKQVLIEHYGFVESDILMLLDDESRDRRPTKDAIIAGFKWLYTDAGSGDLLFFQYSGHGSQIMTFRGQADCICPLDCLHRPWPDSVIVDSEIHQHLYEPLPLGCKAIALFDCCHSGTVANLVVKRDFGAQAPKGRYMKPPQELKVTEAHLVEVAGSGIRKAVTREEYAGHQLWVFSGCQDSQMSADAYIDGTYQGAFTSAFLKAVKSDVWHESYIDLLEQTKTNLRGYTQIPALTTTLDSYLASWYAGRTPQAPVTKSLELDVGHRKALLVGINYRHTRNELRGCINDVNNQKSILKAAYGFQDGEIMMLTEDECQSNWPNKARIVEGMQWLLKDARPGDLLFFQYSGHGSQMTDSTGCEPSGMSDCICPLDCDKPWPEHIILDTELHQHVYSELPDLVKLVCLFDCCHSGTVANLECKRAYEVGPNAMSPQSYGATRFLEPPAHVATPSRPSAGRAFGCGRRSAMKPASGFRRSVAGSDTYGNKLVWVYSGCQDNQTSADAYEDGQYQGAFTWACIAALKSSRFSSDHGALLNSIRDKLRKRYRQIPALSTTTREHFSRYYLGQKQPVYLPNRSWF